ncbi:Serine hydroxymethyltransferase [Candidatus Hepatincolaceae symbiont of Richtersius coronifer]
MSMDSLKKPDFFQLPLKQIDKEAALIIEKELYRQKNTIELIASENIVSKAVLQAQGSVLTNKYAEGYPGKRYYGGCDMVDMAEELAISRAKELFGCQYVNVQPHSGSSANLAVYLAVLKPYETLMGMDLNCGGHLTHGSKVSFSGKIYQSYAYGLNKQTLEIDYEELEKEVCQNKPKLLITGGSAYSKIIDFKRFKTIANKVGALLMVDMAHFAGLVAGGCYPNPFPYADIVTSTTHKTLRGPRGGLILTNNQELSKKIDSAIFPGSQGGPLMHIILAKAVAFKEAMSIEYKSYTKDIIKNAKLMAQAFQKNGLTVVSGGTDSHLFTLDLSKLNITGKLAQNVLDTVNITTNKNSIPFDTLPPSQTSGIRIGTPAITTRGFKEKEILLVVELISKVLKELSIKSDLNINTKAEVLNQVKELCNKLPIY